MELAAPGLENSIVRLEPMDVSHRDVIFDSEIEPSLWKWMPALPGGTSLGHYFNSMLQTQKCGLSATFVLFDQSTDEFVGVTGFNEINKIHRRVRNAVTWHPPHLATSRLYRAGQLAMLERAYAWRAKRIEWQINTQNNYRLGELAFINPKREALFRNFERTADGLWIDKVVFAMTRPEIADAIVRLKADLF
ncbi:MAG: GNAT family N-acetyltransferase [Henriciella sp.]|nr:GNAT family N-acetyltransferase [Henriciella sp.]